MRGNKISTTGYERLRKSLPVLYLFFAICSLLIGCDLFNLPADPDYLKKLDAEIAWANAAKLNVRVEYPAAWGTSNPPQGNITPAMDIRKGYPFEIEFIPNHEYSLTAWLAYPTAALNALSGNWTTDFDLLSTIEAITYNVVLPAHPILPITGGKGEFVINTTEDITLIPWCDTQPRITRTMPRNDPSGRYSVANRITLYFNGPLDTESLSGSVRITEQSINDNNQPEGTVTDITGQFNAPEYSVISGIYSVSIRHKEKLPFDKLITVTVKNIKNHIGEKMTEYSFSFLTKSSLEGKITSWYAVYSGNTIKVECETEDNLTHLQAYYRIGGQENAFTLTSAGANKYAGTITGISSSYNADGVRDGIDVTPARKHEIFIDLYIDDYVESYAAFNIWDIPDMGVSSTNPAIEIFTPNDLANMEVDNPNVKYILANNIELTDWTSVGTGSNDNAFQGTFYGNGHTVTISSFAVIDVNFADIGLFGVVNDGLVRDLTVVYEKVTVSPPDNGFRFGGIAGKMQGNARFENVLVKGAVTTDEYTYVIARTGGIAGEMTDTSSIYNAYGGLNLTVNTKITGQSHLYVGGVAGTMGSGNMNEGSLAKVKKVSVVGDITVNKDAVDDFYVYKLYMGGLTGYIEGESDYSRASLLNSDYRQGTILVNIKTQKAYIGGAVGLLQAYADITNCFNAAQNIDLDIDLATYNIIIDDGIESLHVGGFIGNSYNWGKINNCYSAGPIAIDTTSTRANSIIIAGGFIGSLYSNNNTISYCYTVKGNVSVAGDCNIQAGGFVGNSTSESNLKCCYATGNVSVMSLGNGTIEVGGFAGNTTKVYDCYATGNVFVGNTGTGDIYAGGFCGWAEGDILRCFTTGNVTVERSRSGETYVGGFTGHKRTDDQQNVLNIAVLGESITVIGAPNDCIGRIIGETITTVRSNHAYIGMRLYHSEDYPNGKPDELLLDPLPAWNNKHGGDTTLLNFRTRSFWIKPVPYPFGTAFDPEIHGLGFTGAGYIDNDGKEEEIDHWIFSTVESLGHPILRSSPGGPALGGQ